MSESTVAAPPAVLCEARRVFQDFILPNGKPLRVLQDIGLEVRAGEVVALLGPSGCGKSTLLRVLAGLIRPSQGEVLYHGAPFAGLSPGVAVVFQSFALYPWMTVMENIDVVLKAKGAAPAEREARIAAVVRLVGLSGFEGAYPRELSGGMKQRVGIARALSVDPEMLFMDEPFSQVDALTAESLRAELLDIWAAKDRNPSSILMVSHDIKEVAYMADRIVVLGANPGRILTVVENRLPRPRDYRSPELLRLVDRIHDIITGAEMPDAAPEPARRPSSALEPLPNVSPNEVVGLLEYLDARGGTSDVFEISQALDREFGKVITAVKAAEMLDLVDTPRRSVALDVDGHRFVKADAPGRKALWKEKISKLGLFREALEVLTRAPDHTVDADAFREIIAIRLPGENYNRLFNLLVSWARFGGLFVYDAKTQRMSLPS